MYNGQVSITWKGWKIKIRIWYFPCLVYIPVQQVEQVLSPLQSLLNRDFHIAHKIRSEGTSVDYMRESLCICIIIVIIIWCNWCIIWFRIFPDSWNIVYKVFFLDFFVCVYLCVNYICTMQSKFKNFRQNDKLRTRFITF